MKSQTAFLESPLGPLKITGTDKGVESVGFIDEIPENMPTDSSLALAVKQLKEYFEGSRKEFQIPLNPEGTSFQKKVWKLLETIPFGSTRSYQEMANALGDPKVIRAAASANGKNPIAIIIPCHRVIGSDGSLTGYAGGLHRKKWLLEHENPVKQGVLF